MDIQGYSSVKEEHPPVRHYADVSTDRDYKSTSCIPTILPTLVEEEYNTTTGLVTTPPSSSSTVATTTTATAIMPVTTQPVTSSTDTTTTTTNEEEEEEKDRFEDVNHHLNPALLLNRYDKRKSSPAILGLPFGLNHEAQLKLHLSQQRNSIEAAMLLANFNLMAFPPKANENEHKGPQQQQWQDDMSIPSQNKNSWGDVLTTEIDSNRRHSYDVNMSWQTMSEAFLERPDLLLSSSSSSSQTAATSSNHVNNASSSSSTATSYPYRPSTTSYYHPHQQQQQHRLEAPVFKQENFYNNNSAPTKVSWSHDDLIQQHPLPPPPPPPPIGYQQGTTVEYSNHPISPRQHHNRLYHPTMSSPLAPHPYHPSQQQQRYASPGQQDPHHPGVMLHPLARQPDMKQDPHHQYYSYTFPPQQPHPMQQPGYYYPPPGPPGTTNIVRPPTSGGKLPLNSAMDPNGQQQHYQHHPPPILAKPKRKKQKSNNNSEGGYDDEEIVETNEEDYPDMSTRDVEAARTDPEARPRKQKLRFIGDAYTPQWVRYNGQSKEGLCDTCKPGKWLQLKNSAYWYHKQFFHGISSVSGKDFVQPLETRWVDQDLVEGLCHQCHQWVAVSNVKRKNSVLWYRHAHKCHVYHKPKTNVPKKR